MISRSFTWNNDNDEHSEADTARATALARKWSALKTEEENRIFRLQAEAEEGRFYDDVELEPCKACGGDWLPSTPCTNTNCKGGLDQTPLLEAARRQELANAERELEIELVEDKLAAIGARMMRSYEHWNEDEQLMAYIENRD
jgi:uncharacterized protein (DUF2461 family)